MKIDDVAPITLGKSEGEILYDSIKYGFLPTDFNIKDITDEKILELRCMLNEKYEEQEWRNVVMGWRKVYGC